jgi:hypothetical protein
MYVVGTEMSLCRTHHYVEYKRLYKIKLGIVEYIGGGNFKMKNCPHTQIPTVAIM